MIETDWDTFETITILIVSKCGLKFSPRKIAKKVKGCKYKLDDHMQPYMIHPSSISKLVWLTLQTTSSLRVELAYFDSEENISHKK
jgi:hypothetical protein